MTTTELDLCKSVSEVFGEISLATYYGMCMRLNLRANKKAYVAAIMLLDELKKDPQMKRLIENGIK